MLRRSMVVFVQVALLMACPLWGAEAFAGDEPDLSDAVYDEFSERMRYLEFMASVKNDPQMARFYELVCKKLACRSCACYPPGETNCVDGCGSTRTLKRQTELPVASEPGVYSDHDRVSP